MNRFLSAALGVRAHEFAEVDAVDRPRISGTVALPASTGCFLSCAISPHCPALRGPMYWKKRFYFLKWFSWRSP